MNLSPNQEREIRRQRLAAKRAIRARPKKYKKKIKPGQPDFEKLRLADQYRTIWELIFLQRKKIETAELRLELLQKEKNKIARKAKKNGVRFSHAFDGKKIIVMENQIDRDFENQ